MGVLADGYIRGAQIYLDVNGDGVASMLTIMSGSTRIESMNVSVSGITNFNWNSLGNRTAVQIFTNSYNNITYKLINELGKSGNSVKLL